MSSLVGSHAVCNWFPEHGSQLIAPGDLEAFGVLSPAGKVFACVGADGPWLLVQYGSHTYRVSPTVLAPVPTPAFAVGQRVSANGRPAEISHVEWHFKDHRPIYLLSFDGTLDRRRFAEAELGVFQPPRLRVVLASASPARRQTLIAAGLAPEIIVSDVDEDSFTATDVTGLVVTLAQAKAEAVFATLGGQDDVAVIGCDSLLELDGQAMGKPADAAEALRRWQQMRGRVGHLRTGHQVILRRGGVVSRTAGVASTAVHFAQLSDAEIEAYVATGEPLWVAGAFTIDGLGGAYVTGIEGDPHAVVGISLPLLRDLLADLGVAWHTLWANPAES